MNGRLMTGIGAFLVLFMVNVGLLWSEEMPPAIPKATAELKAADPLQTLNYVISARATNMKKMGFDDHQFELAQRDFKRLGDRLHLGAGDEDKVRQLFEKSKDQPAIVADFCFRGQELHPRYAALAWLVDKKGDAYEVIELDTVSAFERHDWVDELNLLQLYRQLEFADDRKEDATRMALAAILSGRTKDALDRTAPWGNSLLNPWRWRDVQTKTGVEEKLIAYVATFLVVMEQATSDEGGVCTR